MSACAHHRVTIDVYGPSSTILVTASLYCSDDAKGAIAVKAWARAEAKRLGIKLGAWDYVRHDRSLEWEGRVYGEPPRPGGRGPTRARRSSRCTKRACLPTMHADTAKSRR